MTNEVTGCAGKLLDMGDERGRTVHLLCGLVGAGKTTLARRIAADARAVRFSLDEWMLRLYGLRYDDLLYAEKLDGCQLLIWDVAEQVLAIGHDVVLDWNQWSSRRRARWIEAARRAGATAVVHYLDVPTEVAVARAARRGDSDPFSHHLDEQGGAPPREHS